MLTENLLMDMQGLVIDSLVVHQISDQTGKELHGIAYREQLAQELLLLTLDINIVELPGQVHSSNENV